MFNPLYNRRLPCASVAEEPRREVAFSAVGQERDEVLSFKFGPFAQLERGPETRAGRDPDEEPLLGRRAARRLARVVGRDGDNFVDYGAVEVVGHEVRADSLNFMRARLLARKDLARVRLDRDRFDVRVPLFEVFRDALLPYSMTGELDVSSLEI